MSEAVYVNDLFVFLAAVLVFAMQVGFAMLEAGSCQAKNRASILIKNVLDVSVAGIAWWAVGYLLSTGVHMERKSNSGFIGTSAAGLETTAFLTDLDKTGTNYIVWFFGFAFAATAATIVSGAVCERIQFRAYLVYSAMISGFVYPVVAYWAWAPKGWLRVAGVAADTTFEHGYLDFAGSGVVHMVGGCAALVGITMLGPRKYMGPMRDSSRNVMLDQQGDPIYIARFEEDGTVNDPPIDGSSGEVFSALGTLILWMGWYGFNPGSQFGIADSSSSATVGIAAVNTTLGACAAACTYAAICGFSECLGNIELSGILNALLTGLVAVTANCNYVQPWAAALIGSIAAVVYLSSSFLLLKLKLDDVVDAVPVHFFGGIWGVVATGLLVDPDLIGANADGSRHDGGLWYDGSSMLGWQLIGIVAIIAWTASISFAIFGSLHFAGCLRLSPEEEKLGREEHIRLKKIQKQHLQASETKTPGEGGGATETSAPPELQM
jgi:Amt family ammonium transporter